MRAFKITIGCLVWGATLAGWAAAPPETLNYQGVLRDAADNPLSGLQDMIFRFFDAESAGSELAIDEHLAAGTGAIVVDGGLFDVVLGTGDFMDGSGPGTYDTLSEIFRDHTDVWVEVQVGGEVLAPRIKVSASAYALNSTQLGGNPAAFFLDTSAAAQTKSGDLTLGDLTVGGNDIFFGLGSSIQSFGNRIIVTAGADDDDAVELRGGNNFEDGRILVNGQGSIELRPGNGQIDFEDSGGSTRASFAPSGDFVVNDRMDLNGDLLIGNATIHGDPFLGSLKFSGATDVDTLELQPGNSQSDGRIFLVGDGRVEMVAGDGLFEFWNGNSLEQTATLDPDGNLQIADDLTVDGGDIDFTGVGRLSASPLYLRSGTTDYGHFSRNTFNEFGDVESSLTLYADRAGIYFSNTSTPPGIYRDSFVGDMVFRGPGGAGSFRMQRGTDISNGGVSFESTFGEARLYSGNGRFLFHDGSNGDFEMARLEAGGDLHLSGDLQIDGVSLEVSGAEVTVGGGQTLVQGSTVDPSHDLILHAWDQLQGGLEMYGGGEMRLIAGDGNFSFRFGGAGSAETAKLDSTGKLQLDGQLQIDGSRIDHPAAANFTVFSGSSLHGEANSNARTMFDADDSTTGNLAEWFHDGSYATTAKLAELDEDGDFHIRGTLSQNVSFDLAESFLASEPLEAGDLVRVDPARPDAVLRTRGAGDRGVLGVVSARPGVLLGGAPFDVAALRETWGEAAYQDFAARRAGIEEELLARHPDLAAEAEELGEFEAGARALAAEPARESTDGAVGTPGRARSATEPARPDAGAELEELAEEMERRRADLESRLESLALERFCEERLVPVALAGRVPVKAIGPIDAGDPLGPSATPGVAMRADGSGPVIGTALEGLAGGSGHVLAFVHPGFHVPIEPLEQARSELAGRIDERTPDPLTGTQTMPANLQLVLDRDGDDDARFSVFRDGEQDGELGDEVFRVDEAGNVFAKGAFRPASMDVAEYFPTSEPVGPGDVLAVDREAPGRCRRASEGNEPSVVGVVASSPGVLLGGELSRIASVDPELQRELELARELGDRSRESQLWAELEARFRREYAPVALTGTVEVKVDAGYGAVEPGDLLVASPNPGHAMRTDDPRPGTVLGKALDALTAGEGRVRMLVMLR